MNQLMGWTFVLGLSGLFWWLWRRWLRLLDTEGQGHWGDGLHRMDGFVRWFCRRWHRLECEPVSLPEVGGAVLVSNHVSGLDPLLLAAAVNRPLRFLVAREQYNRFGLRRFLRKIGCIPVDRGGRPEKAFRDALKVLRAGQVIAVFPHGRIHLDSAPPRPLKGGAVRLAQLARVPVVPVRLDGVKGEGHVLTALFLRSRARLRSRPPIDCNGRPVDDCLADIERALAG